MRNKSYKYQNFYWTKISFCYKGSCIDHILLRIEYDQCSININKKNPEIRKKFYIKKYICFTANKILHSLYIVLYKIQ